MGLAKRSLPFANRANLPDQLYCFCAGRTEVTSFFPAPDTLSGKNQIQKVHAISIEDFRGLRTDLHGYMVEMSGIEPESKKNFLKHLQA